MKPDEIHQLANLQASFKDIKNGMSPKFLMLNSDKTEVIGLAPKHIRDSNVFRAQQHIKQHSQSG